MAMTEFLRRLAEAFSQMNRLDSRGALLCFFSCAATTAYLVVSFTLLRFYPQPIFMTWFQTLQNFITIFVLGAFGVTFPKFAFFLPYKAEDFNCLGKYLPYAVFHCGFHILTNVLLANLAHLAALPAAAALTVTFQYLLRFVGCRSQYGSVQWLATILFLAASLCSVAYADFALSLAFATVGAVYRGAYLPWALHQDEKEANSRRLSCFVVGMVLCPLLIWFWGENGTMLTSMGLLRLDVNELLVLGCWSTVSVLCLVKNHFSDLLKETSGLNIWRIHELISLLSTILVSWIVCGAFGIDMWIGLTLVFAGRLCCVAGGYDERPPLPIRFDPRYLRERSNEELSMRGRTNSAEESLLSAFPQDKVESISNQLCNVIKAYVTRTQFEEILLLEEMGGTEGVARILQTSPTYGITSDDDNINQRAKLFGKNKLPVRASASFISLCIDAGSDQTLQILMVCGLASIFLSQVFGENPQVEWMEGAAIWIAVLVVVFVTAANDWCKEQQFKQLSQVKDDKCCTVIRDGLPTQVSVFNLVVGDLLQFEAGDELPADCLVVTCRELRIDESSLTGESEMIKKDTLDDCQSQVNDVQYRSPRSMSHHFIASPVVLSGTTVNSGSGTAYVVAVGTRSQAGQLYQKLAFDTEATPLQLKLNALASDIGNFGLISAVIAFLLLVAEFWVIYYRMDVGTRPMLIQIITSHVHFFVTAITILVVAIPEGLPLAVTISLAYSIGQMLADQNYVRRLGACETMGSANEVCSDKTGTLTRNQMTAVQLWNGTTVVDIPSTALGLHEPAGIPTFSQKTDKWKLLMESIALNSTAFLEKVYVTSTLSGKETTRQTIKHVGSATECALLEFADFVCGGDYAELRQTSGTEDKIVLRQDFSSDRKIMTTVVSMDSGPVLSRVRVFVKGASERILALCNSIMTDDGDVKQLSLDMKKTIETSVIDEMAQRALRTICVAYRDIDVEKVPDWKETQTGDKNIYIVAEQNLTCLGIFGIQDPVRDEVPDAVLSCHRAGINVRMVTGDNIITAKAIAKQCNIFDEKRGDIAMLGPDFTALVGGVVCKTCRTAVCGCATDAKTAELEGKNLRVDVVGNMAAFEKIWRRLQVLARSQPSDKYVLVTALKQLGQVVAVTGDGTNDAPALKKADVGLAMGITGKEVAKQAADIVMLDDNFQCIVQAVKWGRNVYGNIRRFLQFQLTVNVVAVLTTIICAAVMRDSPLSAVQMLWVNLIMDSFASLALATERPTPDLLKEKPQSRDHSLISRSMVVTILTSVIYQLVTLLLVIFAGDMFLPETKWGYVSDELRLQYGFSEFSDISSLSGKCFADCIPLSCLDLTSKECAFGCKYCKYAFYRVTPFQAKATSCALDESLSFFPQRKITDRNG